MKTFCPIGPLARLANFKRGKCKLSLPQKCETHLDVAPWTKSNWVYALGSRGFTSRERVPFSCKSRAISIMDLDLWLCDVVFPQGTITGCYRTYRISIIWVVCLAAFFYQAWRSVARSVHYHCCWRLSSYLWFLYRTISIIKVNCTSHKNRELKQRRRYRRLAVKTSLK